jgi:hypothetical protein
MLLDSGCDDSTSWLNGKSRRKQPSPSEALRLPRNLGNAVFAAKMVILGGLLCRTPLHVLLQLAGASIRYASHPVGLPQALPHIFEEAPPTTTPLAPRAMGAQVYDS